MVKTALFAAAAAAFLVPQTLAHPGEAHDHEVFEREVLARGYWSRQAERSLSKCSASKSARALDAINIQRRAATARMLRAERGIVTPSRHLERDAADLAKWEAVNHNRTGIYRYTANTPEHKIFRGVTSAILAPTITGGPYYVWGELIRQNVVEKSNSAGIPLHLEIQYYDVETCKPVPNVYVDIWNCNATGVYSGISTFGNYAAEGYNSTFLRGIQKTDRHGVATFDTVFPGHYSGRATHIHLLSHTNVTVLRNKTLLADTGSVAHIGQLFFNEVLRSAAEAVQPYASNTQSIVSNAADMWSVLQASSSYDPFPEFIYLGNRLEDGLFAWKQIGINMSADYTKDSYYGVAAYLQADGGHPTGNGGPPGGCGGGGPPPGGPPPSGGMPPPSGGALPPGGGECSNSTSIVGTSSILTSSTSVKSTTTTSASSSKTKKTKTTTKKTKTSSKKSAATTASLR